MIKMLAVFILMPFFFSCGGVSAEIEARMDTVLELTADVEAGKVSYETNCVSCHGADGGGTSLGSNISGVDNARDVLQVVLEGKDTMRSYEELSDQELANITSYAQKL